MKQGVRGAGDGSMYHNGILKGFHRHDLIRCQVMFCQPHGLFSGLPGNCAQVLAGSWHKCASRQHQAQCLCHDLHGGSCSHKRAGTAGRTGILFVKSQFFLCDLSALAHGIIHTDLLQGQKVRTCVHDTAGHDNGRDIDPSHPHQMCRHALVTACHKNTAVKRCSIGMDLDHIGDHISGRQGIVDPVVALGFPVTDICGEIPGAVSACLCNACPYLLHKFQEVPAAGMAVTKGTFNHNLRF